MCCGLVEIYQKITFGTDYFDKNLTELIAKLYLAVAEGKKFSFATTPSTTPRPTKK